MTETTVTQPTTKRGDQLAAGDWVRLEDDITEAMYAFRLSHVETYTDERLGDRILVVAHRVGRWNPEVKRLGADRPVDMLTDDEIADAMDTERRELIAARLDHIGQLVRHKDVPLPQLWTAITVNFDFREDVNAVAEFAEAIGVDVAEYGPEFTRTVTFTALQIGSDDRSAGVDLVGRAVRPKVDSTAKTWATEQGPEDGVLTHQVPPTDPDDLPTLSKPGPF